MRVYQLVGFNPKTDYSWLETKKYLKGVNADITNTIISNIYQSDGWVSDSSNAGVLNINDEFTLAIQAVRCQRTSPTNLRWRINFNHALAPDISIAARMDSLNEAVIDYYIFPSIDLILNNIYLKEQNPFSFEFYRFDTLKLLYQLVKRITIPEA